MNKSILNLQDAGKMLPIRNQWSNKGSFGKILLVCGSKNMVGCCVLAAKGALRSGAGLVKLAFPDVLYNSLTTHLSEPVFMPLESDDNGFINYTEVSHVLDEAEKSDVVMIGCGIGVGYAQSLLVTSLIELVEKPIIIDADGLNNLAMCPNILKKAKGNVLLTPHPGEMARLMKTDVSTVESDREGAIKEFCEKYNANVLLKGHETLICNRECSSMYLNKSGNSALAKGGSGDLLSGIIAGLTPSMNGDVFKVGALGAYVHGLCADVLKSDFSEYSILPSDCADALLTVYKIIEESGKD